MNGITYFKLISPYVGDVTKNCGLTGNEVDNNFFVLEGRDIKSVEVVGDALNITLMNGQVISDPDAFRTFTRDFDVSFDKETGKLKVSYNGIVKEFTIAVPQDCPEVEQFILHSDTTLVGDGTLAEPLGISPLYFPGRYRPVLRFIDTTNGESLPTGAASGDRYLVKEMVSAYGDLYDYDGVTQIQCDLNSISSDWRVPTKEDWDDMLNAIEPLEYRNHEDPSCNKYLGGWAGKYLKSSKFWKENTTSISGDTTGDNSSSSSSNTGVTTTGCGCCNCNHNGNDCSPIFYGTEGCCNMSTDNMTSAGIDKFGFGIIPSGYADDGGMYAYLAERGAFWTSTKMPGCASAYMKRFEYNKSTVFQDIISTNYYLSLRLIKNYTGDNFYGRETILGDAYDTILMPSLKNGSQVWTAVNVAFTGNRYHAITPNVGEDSTLVTRYYIAEWDGEKWITNNFNEGEIVTILNAPNGDYAIDYKLINGELVSLSDQLTQDFLDNVNERLDGIEERIGAEEDRAQNAENELQGQITETQTELDQTQAGAGLNDDGTYTPNDNEESLIHEAESLKNADDLLDAALRQEISDRIAGQQANDDEIIIDADYDPDNGEFTLYKKGENSTPIMVQFSFNFGDIDELPNS